MLTEGNASSYVMCKFIDLLFYFMLTDLGRCYSGASNHANICVYVFFSGEK